MFSKHKKIIGTLVPVSALTSLNLSNNDQGTFEAGLIFIDWLHKTGQSAWQMLPLHQTQLEKGSSAKRVPSPYKGYGIGLDPKYLTGINSKSEILNPKQAQNTNELNSKQLKNFVEDNKDWIHDYAFFCALTDYFGTDDWREWDAGLRLRNKAQMKKWSEKLQKEISKHLLLQWELHQSYGLLKQKASKLKIILIGDLPFYLSINSPLVWAHQDVFQLNKKGQMTYVSGLPDTPQAHFGRQVWGHPLYKWGIGNDRKIIDFWKIRLQYLSKLFHSIRFDHAKGLFDYGVIDPDNDSSDKYVKGPGASVFEELVHYCGSLGLSVFAEDSGENLSELRSSLRKLKIPGIKILRFALNEKKNKLIESYASISSYPANTVAYTTTPDTESLLSYLKLLSNVQKKKLSAAADVAYNTNDQKYAVALRTALLKSDAKIVIIQIQDWLLTTDRINVPGTEKDVNDPNWQYMMQVPVENLPTNL